MEQSVGGLIEKTGDALLAQGEFGPWIVVLLAVFAFREWQMVRIRQEMREDARELRDVLRATTEAMTRLTVIIESRDGGRG